jgi:hypothetical protein
MVFTIEARLADELVRPLDDLRPKDIFEFRTFTGLTPTRYVEVRRRFLREHRGHAVDGWPLPAD